MKYLFLAISSLLLCSSCNTTFSNKKQRIKEEKKTLVQKSNETKVNSNFRLLEASEAGNFDDVKTALSNGADVNSPDKNGYTALQLAANNNFPKILSLLLKQKGIDLEASTIGPKALHFAALWGHIECLNLLLKAGANVNAVSDENETALHLAALWGRIDCIKSLLKAGARSNIVDKFGRVALESCSKLPQYVVKEETQKECIRLIKLQQNIINR